MLRQVVHKLAVGGALGLLALLAAAQEVKRVPPEAASITLPDLSVIGQPHGLAVHGDVLYVGASTGVAAVDAAGKLLWTSKLPPLNTRHVDADAEHVAWSGAEVVGITDGTGATAALMWGNPSRAIEVARAEAGLLTAQGQPVWSVKFDEPSALSRPALGRQAVVVLGAKSARLLKRGDGGTVGDDVVMWTNWLGISGNHVTRVAVTPAVWLGDEWIAGHQNWYKRVDAKGEEIVSARVNPGVTAGPMACKDAVYIGEAGYPQGTIFTGKKTRVSQIDAKGNAVWRANLDDELGGVASLACGDDAVYAATNSIVIAVSPAGQQRWEAKSERDVGQLFPGTHRGVVRVRDVLNKPGPAVARAATAGRQMVLAGPYLYITTRVRPDIQATEDLITLLDAQTGAFVEAVEVKSTVIDMIPFGPNLAVVTGHGLKLMALKKAS